mmetsp:Transcript_3279/g.9090  ORF Transcript_3279/g.9090 Transcript_3279/m.9090 type:complete len:98 (+) Transcript_3279:1028-1321(+)
MGCLLFPLGDRQRRGSRGNESQYGRSSSLQQLFLLFFQNNDTTTKVIIITIIIPNDDALESAGIEDGFAFVGDEGRDCPLLRIVLRLPTIVMASTLL